MAEASNTYFNTGAASGRRVTVAFADGEHSVPAWVVAHIGLEELQNDAASLKAISFEDFIAATVSELSSEHLRRFQSQFIARHMGQFQR
ncbi:MAG: hypothetical protein H0T60_08070 [Acidobacteria bacterium]|nr:hypothetical protein [Acidobacteriota bacterium]